LQKAAKTLASRNTLLLRRNHLITIGLHVLFTLFQLLLVRPRSWLLYFIFCSPAVAVEIYLDVIGRPEYSHDGFLRRPGQDLDAPGLTEYMWDVVYWIWINLAVVMALGDWAWWLWVLLPTYTVYLALTTVGGLRAMLSPAQDRDSESKRRQNNDSESKRQQKLGKRAQQRMASQNQY
jgi:SRP-independent targeting protein 2/TMEM208